MERWRNRVAVVTGASTGIGSEIACQLVQAGLNVVGLARRLELLHKLRCGLASDMQERFYAIPCDVSNEQSVKAAFEWIIKRLGGVDVLVNNAGTYKLGQLCTMNVQEVLEVLQTNVMGIVHCTRHAFASMSKRDFNGQVILINSITGHRVIGGTPNEAPESNIYSASKHAVTAINEIYRLEFMGLGTNIKVTSISPGIVNTDLVPANLRQLMADRMLKPRDIADAVCYVLSTPPHVLIHELTIKPMGEVV